MYDDEIQAIKDYLRITHDNDDLYLSNLYDLAISLIKTKTGVEYNQCDSIYQHAVFMCVAHYYDNRTSIVDKAIQEIPYSLNELIKTIAFRGEHCHAKQDK